MECPAHISSWLNRHQLPPFRRTPLLGGLTGHCLAAIPDHHCKVTDVHWITFRQVIKQHLLEPAGRAHLRVLPSASAFGSLFRQLGFHGLSKAINGGIVWMLGGLETRVSVTLLICGS